MSGKKFKMTGFARFFLAMLIIAPLSIIGASYFNGQDGIQTLKELVGLEESVQKESTTTATKPLDTTPSKEYVNSQIKKLQDDLTEKEARVEKLYLENEELKKDLKDKDAELDEVKAKLKKFEEIIKSLNTEN